MGKLYLNFYFCCDFYQSVVRRWCRGETALPAAAATERAATERGPAGKRCPSPGISRGQRLGEAPMAPGAHRLSRSNSAAFLSGTVACCCCLLCSDSGTVTAEAAKLLERFLRQAPNSMKLHKSLVFCCKKILSSVEGEGEVQKLPRGFCLLLLSSRAALRATHHGPWPPGSFVLSIKSHLSAKEAKFCFPVQVWPSSH